MFGHVVQRVPYPDCLSGDAGDVDYGFGVRGARGGRRGQKVGDGELSHSDRVGEVDIQELVPTTKRIVTGLRRPGRVPEGAPRRFEYTRSGTRDVDAAELRHGRGEHLIQVGPRRHVGLFEHGLARVLLDQILRLGSQ